ncbi:MAG: PVC-type heme-binding CxxCH protein [Chthoniobacteraceae bacterium]
MMLRTTLLALVFTATSLFAKTPDGKTLAVLIAGKPSHGPGAHEHNAGVLLLAKCLAQGAPNLVTKVHLNAEWPDAAELAQADTIVIYSDGGKGHPVLIGDRVAQLDKEMKRGCGFVTLHYAVEVQRDDAGPKFLEWQGGYFEADYSVNPHWVANFSELPRHPISNGVKPFSTLDEWYYHMRFRTGMKDVTPILSDLPPASSLSRPDGHHSGNPDVRTAVAAGQKQHVAWAANRPDGGRGFGFTGGHFHSGWANDDQRKLVLNAILWTAKVDVPTSGVESKVTDDDLKANLDPKVPRGERKPAATPAPARPKAASKPADDGDAHATPVATTKTITRGPESIKANLMGAKELHLVVTDAGDGIRADWANWIEPTLVKADGARVPLTSVAWKAAQQGHGETMRNRNCMRQALKVRDEKVVDGIGTHAPSLISFDLPPGVVAFEARVAIDDGGFAQNIGGTAVFQVFTKKPGAAALKVSPDTAPDKGVSLGLAAAKANMKQFKAADGLGASLFAAEPMTQNPTNIDIDPRGRVWAVENVNYRSKMKPWGILREEGDRVVILEDTNGDGEADTEKVFWQSRELFNALGICVLPQEKGTQVIVSSAPNVWLLTDSDGDDKADKTEIIAQVKGSPEHDHQVHAFVFGADGKLYFNFGNESRDLLKPDGTFFTDLAGNRTAADGKPYRQGVVFRCDLVDGKITNVETLGWNFRNNYEVAVDSFGTMWQSDNDDDGNKGVRINYVMPFGNFGFTDEMTGAGWRVERTNLETEIPLRHWHLNDPGVVPNLLQTGAGSPTGILVNEGSALGAKFENQLIHCDAGPRTVRAYPIEADGAGYKATMVDILTSEDPWYRPSDVAIAPDGSLYVADWYDPGVGGHNMGDHEKGKIRGRIYRVAPTGAKLGAPAAKFDTAADCIAALQSPNPATMYVAWQKLSKLGAAAEPDLAKLWKDGTNPRHRARALALLARLPDKGGIYLREGLRDANSDLRIAAIRLTVTLARTKELDTQKLESDRGLMGTLLQDPNPQVRREMALSMHGAKKISELWAALAYKHDGKDRWYLEALGIGAAGQEDECFDALMRVVGDNWNSPGGRDIIWRMRTPKAAPYLVKILEDPSAQDKPRYVRAFDFLPASPGKTKALVQLATAGKAGDDIAREALVRLKGVDLNAEPAVAAAMNGALEKAKGTLQFIELVRDFGIKGQGAAILATAVKFANDPGASDALKVFFAEENWQQTLNDAIASERGADVLALLGTAGGNRGLARLSGVVTNAQQKPELRQAAVRALARTEAGAKALVALADAGKFPEDAKLTAANALSMVQYANLKDAIAKHFPLPNALGGQPLPPIAELVKLSGDIAKGKAIAERAESSCVSCHRIGAVGVDVGPGLTEIGSKLPPAVLFESIISPNAGLSMGFESWQFTLKDGGAAMGIIRSETATEVIVALPGGATVKLARDNIAKREKLATSMMPSGLNQALSKDDLVNLVAYLSSLKTK